MDLFGPAWKEHYKKIEEGWRALVAPEDLVLVAGDISWAMKLIEAASDLKWLHSLPGVKAIIRGNHDYWWSSLAKMKSVMPPSIHIVQNNAVTFNGLSIGGARLWDTPEFTFEGYIHHVEKYDEMKKPVEISTVEADEKIFLRELQRLETSLKAMDPSAERRVVMTHYPPIGSDLKSSRASELLEKYRVDTCVFGHLHNVLPDALPFGTRNGVRYVLSSCDYTAFKPVAL